MADTNDAEQQPSNKSGAADVAPDAEQASLVQNADPQETPQDDLLYEMKEFRQRKKFGAATAGGEFGKQLKNNVFSLIYTTEITSPSFALAIFFVAFQGGLLVLALLDMIQFQDPVNPLQVPTDVSLEVRITGVMCLILAIPLFWDLMDSIERLQQGAPPAGIEGAPKGASTAKYYFAFTLQFLIGALYQIAMFILVVTPNSVVEMFLNFAALEFITEVDEIAFALAVRGYLSAKMKESCVAVQKFHLPPRKGGRCLRRTVYVLLTGLVLGMYGVIWSKQKAGDFDCKRIQVQFGDGFMTTLPIFSGYYKYSRAYYDGRPSYLDVKNRGAAFRYCVNAESGYWVFNHINNITGITSVADMCTNYISRSPYTIGFSIMDDLSNTWVTKRDARDNLEYPVDYFTIRCADCDETNCDGTCSSSGECVCGPGQFGDSCQFVTPPCPSITYDHRGPPFVGAGEFFSSEFDLLLDEDGSPAFAFGRPIYAFSSTTDPRFVNVTDVLMNLGRRYFMFSVDNKLVPGLEGTELMGMDKLQERAIVAKYLTGIHPYYDWIEPQWVYNMSGVPVGRPAFLSAPLDIGTASDNISPLELSWWRVDFTVEVELTEYHDLYIPGPMVETIMLCSTCAHNHPCNLGGTCNFTSGTCICDCDSISGICFGGPTCEVEPPCVANATCVLFTP